jgi:hypothetical protein
VPICHLSRFALFGKMAEAKPIIYLPLALRNYAPVRMDSTAWSASSLNPLI